MVGGSAQGKSAAERRQHRQLEIEQHGIFDGKLAGQPVLMDIVEGEPRLETDDIGRARGKGLGGEAELAGLGNVLGVEHGEQAAAGEGERIVQGLGLGQRQGRRHDDNVELGRQGQGRQGAAGLLIVSLDHELDVELVPGIAERRQAPHQLLQDVGLSMERRQDRVDRQLGVGEPRLTANGRGPPTEETGPAQGGEARNAGEASAAMTGGQRIVATMRTIAAKPKVTAWAVVNRRAAEKWGRARAARSKRSPGQMTSPDQP